MDEDDIYIKPSLKVMYLSIFSYLILFFITVFLLVRFEKFVNEFLNLPNSWHFSGFLAIIVFIFFAFLVLKRFVECSTTHYTITKTSIIVQTGLMNIRKENLESFRIVDISIIKPFYYRFLGLTNIVLHTIDQTSPLLVLNAIESTDTIEKRLKDFTSKKNHNVIETVGTTEQ